MGIDEETWRCIDQLVVEVHDGDDGRVQKITELCRSKGFANVVTKQEATRSTPFEFVGWVSGSSLGYSMP